VTAGQKFKTMDIERRITELAQMEQELIGKVNELTTNLIRVQGALSELRGLVEKKDVDPAL